MFSSVLRAIRAVSLSVWLGGGVMTFITAHYVFFGGYLDKTTAGDVMGAILHAAGLMKLGLAALALGAHFGLRGNPWTGRKPHKIEMITLLIASAIAVTVAFYLEPKMVELRAQFRGDDNLQNPAHVAFGKLHGASMGLSLLELICVTAAVICSVL